MRENGIDSLYLFVHLFVDVALVLSLALLILMEKMLKRGVSTPRRLLY